MTSPNPSSAYRSSFVLPNVVLPQRPQLNPVDLRALEYVGSYDHNLMCAICRSPFVDPVRLECEHVFCSRCVNQAMISQETDTRIHNLTCPSCRRLIKKSRIAPGPKILSHILDDLPVRCPLKSEGCIEAIPRSSVQQHVDKYCAYSEVECPADACLLSIFRKDLEENRCLHHVVQCEDCKLSLMERDLKPHQNVYCEIGHTFCPDCKTRVPSRELEAHIQHCPDAIFPCTAAPYGCDFIARKNSLEEHSKTCPLSKLVPFLKMQTERLDAHETALRHLRHKNSILETSFSTIHEALSPSANLIDSPSSGAEAGSDPGPFDSTAHHLLCLHESLREEVNRVSAAVSEVDAKASMMVMNESLRMKEDMAYTNAAVGGMRAQLHWLMSARLQNQQRIATVRAQSSSEVLETPMSTGTSPSGSIGPSGNLDFPVRRMSDSTRQETKL